MYKVKKRIDGTLERKKARLVARGFSQVEGLDFVGTYSPVVKFTTICVIISLAVSQGWVMNQLDLDNAFLNDNLKESVYMTQLLGFVHTQHPHYVCKLNKSLYGL